MGGLGNQLFQIFTTMAYGIRSIRKVVFPYSETLTTGVPRPTYWHTFLSYLKRLTTIDCASTYTKEEISKFPMFREQGHHYSEIPSFDQPAIILFGYFQSPRYFENEKKQIFETMRLTEKREQVKMRYNQYFEDGVITLSMHFRLGDYKQKQNYHPILPYEYYRNALFHIMMNIDLSKSVTVLYFCESEDNDVVSDMVSRLHQTFTEFNFKKVDDTISDWEQLMIMSNCHHNIIANSSYSWWGAYFNENPQNITCYPTLWFGPAASKNDISTMFPNGWRCIAATG
jgi:hypothetical protein